MRRQFLEIYIVFFSCAKTLRTALVGLLHTFNQKLMRTEILSTLHQLEKEHNIQILLAVESGSRAWGFPSPDSDYDVRFLYCHPLEWYLSLDEQKDSLNVMDGELDLSGWELRKSLRLLRKTNAPLLEYLQSPILYLEQEGFREAMLRLGREQFSGRAGLHHYLSMAVKYYTLCQEAEEVKLKHYFYLLRTTLASLWIIEKQSLPPMELQLLLPLIPSPALKEKVGELLALKAKANESYRHPKDAQLDAYLQETIRYCEAGATTTLQQAGTTTSLNNFFRKTINKTCHSA